MLNNINRPIAKLFAAIQNEVAETAACSTPEMERAHMVAGGKERIYLNQLATKLTGNLINRLPVNVVDEEEVTVYANADGVKQPRPRTQSLNASLYMVACYSVLMSGYTSAAIIESALINWADEDSIKTTQELDFKEVAKSVTSNFIAAGILNPELEEGQMDTGERFKGHAASAEIQELRLVTIQKLWDAAPPKMQPMKHKLTWSLNGTCELKNLRLCVKGTQAFIDALNNAGHTAYKVNPAIRAEIKRKLKRGQYPADQQQTMRALLALDCNLSLIHI